MNEHYTLRIAMAFGLESVVSFELRQLGLQEQQKGNGFITVQGTLRDMARCNLWLRSADRVALQLAEFPADDFDSFFDGLKSVPWGDLVEREDKITINARSKKSALQSVPTLQSMGKKAVLETLGKKYGMSVFPETGHEYHVELVIDNDRCVVLLDTTGPGLNRRGYRNESGRAPMRETLAAGIIDLARWKSGRPFHDPMCGSGTLAIEAALRGRNMAPGQNRNFSAEKWNFYNRALWGEERHAALDARSRDPLEITASDIDSRVVASAQFNARRAGVSDSITFFAKDISQVILKGDSGVVATNPPYGDRLELQETVYQSLASLRERYQDWSFFILSPEEKLDKKMGARADKNRKLFNGGIKTWLYSFFGKRV